MSKSKLKLCPGLNDTAMTLHKSIKEKGFYDNPREIGTLLMLCVSELAEAMEADRKDRKADLDSFIGFNNMGFGKDNQTYLKEDAIPSFEKHIKDTFEDELADTMIRILDLCAYRGIDIETHINIKTEYNATRSQRHGGKKY